MENQEQDQRHSQDVICPNCGSSKTTCTLPSFFPTGGLEWVCWISTSWIVGSVANKLVDLEWAFIAFLVGLSLSYLLTALLSYKRAQFEGVSIYRVTCTNCCYRFRAVRPVDKTPTWGIGLPALVCEDDLDLDLDGLDDDLDLKDLD